MDIQSETDTERLSQIIEEHHNEIEQRWLEQVSRDIVRRPGVELTQLRDGMPDYLVELGKALKVGSTRESVGGLGESAWSKVAKDHGITRVRIGFDISQLVHEFVVLRRVIYEVAQRHGAECTAWNSPLTDLLDSAIGIAVQAYVDARDYEGRRAQAANIGFLIHELRQPLSAATLAAARLRPSAVTDQLSSLDVLDRTLSRLGDLIKGVLLTEQLEAGQAQLQLTQVTLRELMEPVDTLKTAADAKGLEFRATYDPALTAVLDPTLTRAIIRNLVENAVKYTDQGVVDVSVTNTRDEIVLDVRDTCRGLSQEELSTIFEPFKRGRTDKTGTGLGLAIARRATEAQGGSIQAESPGPSGCHFSVRLPRWVDRSTTSHQ
jgi:signal transduction histidine kinase